jgi:hypothetical protein
MYDEYALVFGRETRTSDCEYTPGELKLTNVDNESSAFCEKETH